MCAWFKRVRKDDPVFGSMLYMGDKLQYWEGNAHFAPAARDIEVFVDGTSEDSMDEQRGFYEKVSQNWAQWSVPILEKIRGEREPDSKDAMHVSSMSIPRSRFADDSEWEVSFSAEPSGGSYTVKMRGPKPESVEWDC
jgi:hypothetical protein